MLFALIFVAAPHSWMRDIHQWVELGEMPNTPVVWYLARSTSAFYAIVGGLFLLVSRDLKRHRPILMYLGWSVTFFGAVLLIIDVSEGMPSSWTLSEGPFSVALGLAMFAFFLRPRRWSWRPREALLRIFLKRSLHTRP